MFTLARLKREIIERRSSEAKAKQRCVVVVANTTRKRGRTDANSFSYRAADVLSCLHSVSYTMPCKHCRRSTQDANANRARIAQKLKNQ